jgi:hypothetical protein
MRSKNAWVAGLAVLVVLLGAAGTYFLLKREDQQRVGGEPRADRGLATARACSTPADCFAEQHNNVLDQLEGFLNTGDSEELYVNTGVAYRDTSGSWNFTLDLSGVIRDAGEWLGEAAKDVGWGILGLFGAERPAPTQAEKRLKQMEETAKYIHETFGEFQFTAFLKYVPTGRNSLATVQLALVQWVVRQKEMKDTEALIRMHLADRDLEGALQVYGAGFPIFVAFARLDFSFVEGMSIPGLVPPAIQGNLEATKPARSLTSKGGVKVLTELLDPGQLPYPLNALAALREDNRLLHLEATFVDTKPNSALTLWLPGRPERISYVFTPSYILPLQEEGKAYTQDCTVGGLKPKDPFLFVRLFGKNVCVKKDYVSGKILGKQLTEVYNTMSSLQGVELNFLESVLKKTLEESGVSLSGSQQSEAQSSSGVLNPGSHTSYLCHKIEVEVPK